MESSRKRFGQHFLNDQFVIQQIIAALKPRPNEHLIEIGPGKGALTLPILDAGIALEAIELDRDLIPILRECAKEKGQPLRIIEEDVLTIDFSQLKTDDRPLRVFGNLPYNISTPLIFHLLQFAPQISDMLFMLQKEVAQRLAAHPSSKEYGRLSVMVQYHCKVNRLFDVSAQSFNPPPQVTSSMVQLFPYIEPPYVAKNYALFAQIVRESFGQRRKTLRKSLKKLISDSVWMESMISSDLRPENLAVKDFVKLSNLLMGMS